MQMIVQQLLSSIKRLSLFDVELCGSEPQIYIICLQRPTHAASINDETVIKFCILIAAKSLAE